MKSLIKSLFSLLVLLVLLKAHTIHACTIISANSEDSTLFGGNMDLPPTPSFMAIDKRGDLGVIYFGTPWKHLTFLENSGINERGLCFDINWLPKEKLISQPEKMRQNEWIITKVMQEASTVDEVLEKIVMYNWGDSLSYQVHFADRSGASAIVYPGLEGELTFSRRQSGKNYLISTNFNHARRLRASFLGLDVLYKLLFDSKYRTAEKLLVELNRGNPLTVEFMASILEATHRNWWFTTPLSMKTIYSTVFDLKRLRVYLYRDQQFDDPHVIDVNRLLLKNQSYKRVSLKELDLGDTQ